MMFKPSHHWQSSEKRLIHQFDAKNTAPDNGDVLPKVTNRLEEDAAKLRNVLNRILKPKEKDALDKRLDAADKKLKSIEAKKKQLAALEEKLGITPEKDATLTQRLQSVESALEAQDVVLDPEEPEAAPDAPVAPPKAPSRRASKKVTPAGPTEEPKTPSAPSRRANSRRSRMERNPNRKTAAPKVVPPAAAPETKKTVPPRLESTPPLVGVPDADYDRVSAKLFGGNPDRLPADGVPDGVPTMKAIQRLPGESISEYEKRYFANYKAEFLPANRNGEMVLERKFPVPRVGQLNPREIKALHRAIVHLPPEPLSTAQAIPGRRGPENALRSIILSPNFGMKEANALANDTNTLRFNEALHIAYHEVADQGRNVANMRATVAMHKAELVNASRGKNTPAKAAAILKIKAAIESAKAELKLVTQKQTEAKLSYEKLNAIYMGRNGGKTYSEKLVEDYASQGALEYLPRFDGKTYGTMNGKIQAMRDEEAADRNFGRIPKHSYSEYELTRMIKAQNQHAKQGNQDAQKNVMKLIEMREKLRDSDPSRPKYKTGTDVAFEAATQRPGYVPIKKGSNYVYMDNPNLPRQGREQAYRDFMYSGQDVSTPGPNGRKAGGRSVEGYWNEVNEEKLASDFKDLDGDPEYERMMRMKDRRERYYGKGTDNPRYYVDQLEKLRKMRQNENFSENLRFDDQGREKLVLRSLDLLREDIFKNTGKPDELGMMTARIDIADPDSKDGWKFVGLIEDPRMLRGGGLKFFGNSTKFNLEQNNIRPEILRYSEDPSETGYGNVRGIRLNFSSPGKYRVNGKEVTIEAPIDASPQSAPEIVGEGPLKNFLDLTKTIGSNPDNIVSNEARLVDSFQKILALKSSEKMSALRQATEAIVELQKVARGNAAATAVTEKLADLLS